MDRVTNVKDIKIIEELIKCIICQNILNVPYECETCGALFCEECIHDWLKIKVSCPAECDNLKLAKAKINTKKMLNLVKLNCINAPSCTLISDYSGMLSHEKNCQFQKIACPNKPCSFEGHYHLLNQHMINECEYINYECSFCRSRIFRKEFAKHLDEHYQDKTFSVLNCTLCESSENLRRCWCKKSICSRCILNGKNSECRQNCYVFQNNIKTATQTYNISKYPLPKNCEIKLLFNSVDWIRTGITFSKEIINDQTDSNCPSFDIYCILEDLVQFYTKASGWKNCFNKGRELRSGDYMTIILKNGEWRYEVNNLDLGGVIKIDMTKKKDAYLFIHLRNQKSKVELVYITEIFN